MFFDFFFIYSAQYLQDIISMFPLLQKNTHYTNTGGILSKLLFIQENLSTWKESILFIAPNQALLKKHLLLAPDIALPLKELETYEDLIELSTAWTPHIYITTPEGLEYTLNPSSLENTLTLTAGQQISMETCIRTLQDLGYEFQEYGKAGSYFRKWDMIHIQKNTSQAYTLSFWWDEIESIILWSTSCTTISLWDKTTLSQQPKGRNISLQEYLETQKVFLILDSLEFHHLYEPMCKKMHYASFDILYSHMPEREHVSLWVQNLVIEDIEAFKTILSNPSHRVTLYSRHSKMVETFLMENNFWHIPVKAIHNHIMQSFVIELKNTKNVIICDDIITKIFIKKRIRKKLSADIDLLLKIKNDDYIVHIDHGIGIFKGIIKKRLPSPGRKGVEGEMLYIEKEYLKISYAQNDTLFVPITEVHRVSKYIGSENPKLTPLSGKVWEKKMKKIHEDIREIAESILKNFAERKLRKGKAYQYSPTEISRFQSYFPYTYTPDQAVAIEEIFTDMQSEKNMDRLLVWDVWFGKTEIAFNAAYLAMQNKRQVVLISPLVVLAHEHYEKAKQRFHECWVNIEILTRLQSQAHATKVLAWLAHGSIDMVIGTHRLLSEKIKYKNLGLLIIDEEHKFWVSDKEKIKAIRANIDILSLSATPIPRSLNLALSGVRDISLIKTPPSGRKSIKSSVLQYNETLIYQAGKREFDRGGQVFFVHNRVSNIEVIKKQLESIFPNKKVIISHGQLPWEELENRILGFKHKKYDILLSTTVIENGIDFPNVNTIFINECQQFWISQIHQLRGRVGRSDRQGYCYLLYRRDHIDGEAAKRMQTIVDYSYLGAGFELAMKDLEIRWGGDILGVRQSGQAKEIGVSLFLKMLEEKIAWLKENTPHHTPEAHKNWENGRTKTTTVRVDTKMDLMISAGIPDTYFLSETDKLNFYREIEMIQDIGDLEYLKNTLFNSRENILQDEATENLFLLLELKIFTTQQCITHIKKVWIQYHIEFHHSISLEEIKDFLARDVLVRFQVIDAHKLRAATKLFANEKNFIEYLLQVLQGKVKNPKLRLVKKYIS